jgi:acetylornithine/N-succinyldiaminopimelate aminotransferase
MKSKTETLRNDFFRHLCQTSHEPMGIVVNRAKGSTVTDADGKRYLDFISGIGVAGVGHAHPRVVRAIREQAARYLHVMVYGEFIQAAQVRLASRLAGLLPPNLSVVYFTNSGTEAVEGAIKTAKKFTGRKKLVAFKNGFHGDSQGSLSVTGREVYRRPFLPLLPHVAFLPFNDPAALGRIDSRTAAAVIEPIQGEGGVNIPSKDFLTRLRRRCTETGTVLIFDEVMTGFGRTGRLFAFQHWGVIPDILVLAKSLGGGMPLGAFIGDRRLMRTLSEDPPLSHVTTFGGHPVCCAAGLAALEVVIGGGLPAKARAKGRRIVDALLALRSRTPGIRAVRGMGLLIGLELDSAERTRRFAAACRESGLLLGWTLHSDRVIRLAPPLVITEREIDRALRIMERALAGTRRR